MHHQIELLAPGGDPLAVKAAVLAGADAVYLGIGDCNARRRAINILPRELPGLCRVAHARQCRIYLAMNTLVAEAAFPELVSLLHEAIAAGIDAVIIQDYGLLGLVRRLFPALEIHASTQLTTHNRGQLALLARCGVAQVNLSRELPLEAIRALTEEAHHLGMRTEVFVHGALCVSFSGQCHFSGLLYDNPGNRGACVQPCRRAYTVAGDRTQLRPFNLKDNSLFASAAALIAAGVDALKIEGRIKGFEYVHAVVAAWRAQLDRIAAGSPALASDPRLAAVFNRGFSDNLFTGRLAGDSFSGTSEDESLRPVGTVAGYHADSRELGLQDGMPLAEGASLTIRRRNGEFVCTGTVTECLGNHSYRFLIRHQLRGKILAGQRVFSPPLLEDGGKLRETLVSLEAEENKTPLALALSGSVGAPLELRASTPGRTVVVRLAVPLAAATGQTTAATTIRERLAKLGGTPYALASLDLSGLDDGLFIPLKTLGELRREAVAQLLPPLPAVPALVPATPTTTQQLAVVFREAGLAAALPRDGSLILCYRIPAAVPETRALITFLGENRDLVPWFPPILVGSQFEDAATILREAAPTRIVTDNGGIAALAAECGIPWIAGSRLNTKNGHALALFRELGAVGALPEAEFDREEHRRITVPQGITFWGALLEPLFLMHSRHCLVRQCRDCGKTLMDEACLAACAREATVTDESGKPLYVVKRRGEYPALYGAEAAWYPERIGNGSFPVLFLDCDALPDDAARVSGLAGLATAAVRERDRTALARFEHELRRYRPSGSG